MRRYFVPLMIAAYIAVFLATGFTITHYSTQAPEKSLGTGRQAIEQAEKAHVEAAIIEAYMTDVKTAYAYIETHGVSMTPEERMEIAIETVNATWRYGHKLDLMLAAMCTESTFKRNTTGKDGEYGLMQVHPNTFAWLRPNGDPADWRQTLDAGAEYLQKCMMWAHGDWRQAIVYYNAGPTPSAAGVEQASRHLGKVDRYRMQVQK